MAEVRPFRGIRYSKEKIQNFSSVITLPYDRITPELQERYYNRHPFNYVRIVLPGEENRYEIAKERIENWLKERILIRDEEPAFYLYSQEFKREGQRLTRKGLVAALRLEEFDKGIVLPHERTLSKPKEDRLRMMRATKKNLGNVFMLYPDPENEINQAFEKRLSEPPEIKIEDEYGITHKLWKESDSVVIEKVRNLMKDKVFLIADGHHRYETSLNYRDEVRRANPDYSPDAPFNYRMVTLVNLFDPGLVVLPTHRLIFNLKEFDAEKIRDVLEGTIELIGTLFLRGTKPIQKLDITEGYFDVKWIEEEDKIEEELKARSHLHCFGMYTKEGACLLTLKNESLLQDFVKDRSQDYRTLDVTILHFLILEHILSISPEKVEDHIRYEREAKNAIEKVKKGEFQIAFLLNPTKAIQVEKIAKNRERMPQKSTDFYPKVSSGFVVFDLGTW